MTPSCSLYLELCIIPIKFEIYRRKLLFYRKIITENNDNIIKQIYNNQSNSQKNNWYREVQLLKKELDIQLQDDKVKGITKGKWKKIVDKSISRSAFDFLVNEKSTKSKLKHLQYSFEEWTCKSYF